MALGGRRKSNSGGAAAVPRLMQTIFVDESGYTGEHLLDTDQPVFALASHHLSETTSVDVKSQFFGRVQARELKYSQLRRRPSQQQMVVRFVREMAASHRNKVKIYVAQKRYGLTAKIVDILVEKVVYAFGRNIYEMQPELLATSLFAIIPARCGEPFFQDLLERFAAFVRSPTEETYEAFFAMVREPQRHPLVDQLFHLLRACENIYGRNLIDRDELGNLDLAIPMAFALANWWQMDVAEPLRIVHDQTSNLAEYRDLWDALVDPAVAQAVVGVGGRVAQFPINVTETLLEPSHQWAGLQLADVLAGAASAAAAVMIYGNTDQEFEKQLVDPLFEMITQAMVPAPPGYEHPRAPVEPQAADLPEHMAAILRNKTR